MGREITPFALRMPPGLREKVEQAAKENGRSINSELIARIAGSFEAEADGQIDEERLERIERIVEEAVGRALRRQERD